MATFWEIAGRSVSNLFSLYLSICNIYLFPVLVLGAGMSFDCSSSCSLLFYYFDNNEDGSYRGFGYFKKPDSKTDFIPI